AFAIAPPIGTAEEIRGIVLDAQHLAAIERLAADERVLALFEPEPQHVRGRDELRLSRLLEQAVDVEWLIRRRLAVLTLDDEAVVGDRDGGVGGRRLTGGGGPLAPLLAFLLPLQVVGLELATVAVADLDAVELQWAADEEAVADE